MDPPENTLELGPPLQPGWADTAEGRDPQPCTPQPSGHSCRGGCKPRPVVPQLGMQSRRAEAFPSQDYLEKRADSSPRFLEGRLLEEVSKLKDVKAEVVALSRADVLSSAAARPLQGDCSMWEREVWERDCSAAAGVTVIGLKLG